MRKKMRKKRIIYILCPGHSGSTLMEYYLSTYKNSIGIGEAYKAVQNFQNGEIKKLSEYDQHMIKNNPFWNEIFSRTERFKSTEKQYIDMYRYLLESDKFSGYQTIIDSSKNMEGLRTLTKYFKDITDVVVVYKDIRSWIVSMIDNSIRKDRKIPMAYKYRLARQWWKTYSSFHEGLKKMNMNYVDVSYDLFCLDHEKTANNMKDNLNLEGKADLKNTNSINILGNRMKKEANSGLKISYDYRWMYRNEWNFMWMLVPSKIKKFNNDQVWNISR